MFARGRLKTAGRVEEAGAVFDTDRLRAGRLTIDLDAPKTRQDIGSGAVDEVAAIELGRDRNGETESAPGGFHFVAFGNRPDEVTAKHYEGRHPARDDSFAGIDGVHALFARRRKAELFGKAVERHQLGLFRNAHSALTLHVGMAADGTYTSTRFTYVAAQQQ